MGGIRSGVSMFLINLRFSFGGSVRIIFRFLTPYEARVYQLPLYVQGVPYDMRDVDFALSWLLNKLSSEYPETIVKIV